MFRNFILIFVFFISCESKPSSRQILNDFDSINNSLDLSVNTSNATADELYRMLETKRSNSINFSSISELHQQLRDFYDYLSEIKTQFIVFCGDKEGHNLPPQSWENENLTRKFFLIDKQVSFLPAKLERIRRELMRHTSSPVLFQRISGFGIDTVKTTSQRTFLELYFANMSPVGAITILNSFESRAIVLETEILMDYLKK